MGVATELQDQPRNGPASIRAGQDAVPAARDLPSLAQACSAPWEVGYLNLLRYLAARHPEMPPIGMATRPQQEPFRLGQQPSLVFAPREIAEVTQRHDGRTKIRLFGLGLIGPNGALPIHATEIAHDRKEHRKDTTLVDFLDIFHHRWMTLFYRAWAGSQAAAGLDRPAAESFSRYVGLLSGTDPGQVAGSPLAVHARLAAAAHHIREARNPDGLTRTLAHFFGFPVRMEEFILHWITLDPAERTYLGKPGAAATLGNGAISGEKVPDRQHKFRLVLGPLDMAQYLRLVPGGRDLPVLIEWVRSFVGFEYVWEIELHVRPEVMPVPRSALTGDSASRSGSRRRRTIVRLPAWCSNPSDTQSFEPSRATYL